MGINLTNYSVDTYYDVTYWPEFHVTHVAWPFDDLAELAADIHRTVADLLLHGPGGPAIDAAIIDRLRGTATRADDAGGLPG